MLNYIKSDTSVTLTAPAGGVISGAPVLVGGIVVVATNTVAAGLPFEGMTEGQFTLPKTAGTAWTEGQVLCFDSATSSFTTVQSATARRAGFATTAAASGSTTGTVMLVNVGALVNVA